MKTILNPKLSPTSCLDVDSAAAQELTWLPYAVRFKLDECGLAISLQEWQQLPIAQRVALVHAPLIPGAGGFQPLALASGLRVGSSGRRAAQVALEAGDLECLRGGDIAHWLACATPFAKYVLRKIARRREVHEAA